MAEKAKQKPINLALQGGGAHGAFTWGVLDALLEDDRLDFEGISATSAGAMNAAILAQGKTDGGADKARELLEDFWREVSTLGAFVNPFAGPQNAFARFWNLDANPAYSQMQSFIDGIVGSISPYQFNPANVNPLRTVLEKIVNLDQIHTCKCVKLFITAKNVHDGTADVFENENITHDVLLASAALPLLFQAV